MGRAAAAAAAAAAVAAAAAAAAAAARQVGRQGFAARSVEVLCATVLHFKSTQILWSCENRAVPGRFSAQNPHRTQLWKIPRVASGTPLVHTPAARASQLKTPRDMTKGTIPAALIRSILGNFALQCL